MEHADPEIVDPVNTLAEERFLLELQKEELTRKYKSDEVVLKAEYQARLSSIQSRINQVDSALLGQIKRHREGLITKGKQSFVTLVAKFQFKKPTDTEKITDVAGIMAIARKLRVVRQIAVPVRDYKLDRRKFNAWLKKHPEYRDAFSEYLEPPTGESLTIQPNGTYTVLHDSKRISPPSVSIKAGAEDAI